MCLVSTQILLSCLHRSLLSHKKNVSPLGDYRENEIAKRQLHDVAFMKAWRECVIAIQYVEAQEAAKSEMVESTRKTAKKKERVKSAPSKSSGIHTALSRQDILCRVDDSTFGNGEIFNEKIADTQNRPQEEPPELLQLQPIQISNLSNRRTRQQTKTVTEVTNDVNASQNTDFTGSNAPIRLSRQRKDVLRQMNESKSAGIEPKENIPPTKNRSQEQSKKIPVRVDRRTRQQTRSEIQKSV